MKQIGLTGGIASGKSLLSEILIKLGVSVYNADKNAAALMESDTGLIEELKKIVGSDAYINGKLNKSLFTEIIFNNPELRNKINSAVHPLVWNKWNEWCGSHSCSYVIIESALLFQTGFFNKLDAVIVVNSVEEVRVKRLEKRDGITSHEAEIRIKSQMYSVSDNTTIPIFEINNNNDNEMLLNQVLDIHSKILAL